MCVLGSEEQWLVFGSLHFHTVYQLKLLCQRSGKWGEIPYIQTFMLLHNKDAKEKANKLMVQGIEKVCPDTPGEEEKTSETQELTP